MRVPLTAAAPPPTLEELPSDTMLMMAAAVMHQQGKFASLTETLDTPAPSLSAQSARGINVRREMEDKGWNEHDPRGELLGPGNDRVPGNRGPLGPWNRRT